MAQRLSVMQGKGRDFLFFSFLFFEKYFTFVLQFF